MSKLSWEKFTTGEGRKEDLLGRGGFGSVHRCYYQDEQQKWQTVAIKLAFVGQDKMAKMEKGGFVGDIAKREMEMLRKVKGLPHVMQAYGYIEHGAWVGLVLEYMERENLFKLYENVNLPWILRVRVMGEVADGMAHLHKLAKSARMTHNDLKPQNILIDRDFHVKIGDLGASNIDNYSDGSHYFYPYDGKYDVRTRIYAAPVFLCRPHAMTRRRFMDVYSYAMVVYFVLTGMEPFQGYSKEDLKSALKKCQKPNINKEELRKALSREEMSDFDVLCGIMEKGWVYDEPVDEKLWIEKWDDSTVPSQVESEITDDTGYASIPPTSSSGTDQEERNIAVAKTRPTMEAIAGELKMHLDRIGDERIKAAEKKYPYPEQKIPEKLVKLEKRCKQLEEEMGWTTQ